VKVSRYAVITYLRPNLQKKPRVPRDEGVGPLPSARMNPCDSGVPSVGSLTLLTGATKNAKPGKMWDL